MANTIDLLFRHIEQGNSTRRLRTINTAPHRVIATYIAGSQVFTIRRKIKGTDHSLIPFQYTPFLQALPVPFIQYNLLLNPQSGQRRYNSE